MSAAHVPSIPVVVESAIRSRTTPRWAWEWSAFAALVVAGGLAYLNSLGGPFVFDDEGTIVGNASIRQLGPWWEPLLTPAGGVTTSGRPFANLTLALNYAWGGLDVRGYHLVNLAIHLAAGLVLFGLVRRTFGQAPALARWRQAEWPVALGTAAWWLLHPLQTEAVTYVSQRTEALMGLCYLLTLYAFLRGTEGEAHRQRWYALAVVACLLGMASKEVMVSAPVIVLLFDRTFVAGRFAAAWRQRAGFYVTLATTWLLLAALVIGTGGNRGATIGFGVDVPWWRFELTQFPALMHYLKLVGWPEPLVFDYGLQWADDGASLVLPILGVVGLVAATGIGLWQYPTLGFCGAMFFAVLAPTSLLPGIRQTMAEHRLYLALVPLGSILVLGGYALVGRRAWLIVAATVVGLGLLTAARNRVYQSEIALWSDTVAKNPTNAFAQANLGHALAKADHATAAVVAYQAALQLAPDSLDVRRNLGLVLLQAGRPDEAVACWDGLLRVSPEAADVQYDIGNALTQLGRLTEAIGHYQTAVRLSPDFADAHCNLGNALAASGAFETAAEHYQTALRIAPSHVGAHTNLGNLLAQAGRFVEAAAQYEAVLQADPAAADARNNLGNVYLETGRWADAAAEYREALRIRPGFEDARRNLARATALGATHTH